MRRLRSFAFVAAASASLVACGDDGGNTTPDAPTTPDSNTPDSGPSCTTTVALDPAFSFNDQSDDEFVAWSQEVTTSLGGGGAFVNYEFYNGIESTLSGAINLTSGNQANYKTCAACIRLLVINAAGDAIEKQFFQSGGTLNLSVDPFDNHVLMGTTTDLTLTEVTIAQDFTSTPVSGGTCISLGSLTLAADSVPAEWTCEKSKYSDGTTCDCACGAHDPDCDSATAAVAGCTGVQVCGPADTCVEPAANDTCASAQALTIGTPATGDTSGARPNYNEGLEEDNCTTYSQSARDVVYKVDLTAGQQVVVSLTAVGAEFDPSISVVGPGAATICDANPIVCNAGTDAGAEGENETLNYTAGAAGTYYIIVDSSYGSTGGAFTITVSNPPV